TILRYTSKGGPRNDLQIEAFSWSTRGGPANSYAMAAVLEQAEGTGTLELQSADPHAAPVICQHFCEDERDLVRLRECFKDTMAYTQTKAMKEITAEILFPEPNRPLTDEAIDDLLRRFAASGFHPCATLRMGPEGDPDAVVDQYGHAHAVEGLVVADASIMPTVPRANTNLTSIMIGEMIGEWVRTRPDWYGL
ncbi:MAG TPA: GMC oxidoreductase, partial [Gemmatimonadales bacterium]|nr:GMC oxidoreductase [Gemmatimonadales bacterium]